MVCPPLLLDSILPIWTSWTNLLVGLQKVSLLAGSSSAIWQLERTSVLVLLELQLGGTCSAPSVLTSHIISSVITCSALPKTNISRYRCIFYLFSSNYYRIFPSFFNQLLNFLFYHVSIGSGLCHLPWPSSHDNGFVSSGHHWDVERPQQFVRKPVDAGHAALVQYLAHFCHRPLNDSSLYDSLRRDLVDRLSDLPSYVGRVDCCSEDIVTGHPARWGAQVLRAQIQRRWESLDPLPLDCCRLGDLFWSFVPIPALSNPNLPTGTRDIQLRNSHSELHYFSFVNLPPFLLLSASLFPFN